GKGKRRAPGAWPHYDTGQEPTDFNYPGVSADPGDVVCKLWIRHKLRPRDPFVKCSPDLATLATQASLLLIHCYDRLERLALSIHSFDRLRHGLLCNYNVAELRFFSIPQRSEVAAILTLQLRNNQCHPSR